MKLFLATPITKHTNEITGLMDKKTVEQYKVIYKMISKYFDGNIFFAAKEECWGKKKISDKECCIRDYSAMEKSDMVIVILFSEVSQGVLIELGWATSLGKPIEIIMDRRFNSSKLLRGIKWLSYCNIHVVDFFDGDEMIFNNIENALIDIVDRKKKIDIIDKFIRSWEQHDINMIEMLLNQNVRLRHPYFTQEIIGREDVVKNLSTINLDYSGKSAVTNFEFLDDDRIEIRVCENLSKKSKISQNLVLHFTVKFEIEKIEFVGVEISDYIYHYRERKIRSQNKNISDEDIIFQLAKSWSEKNYDKYIMLFSEDALITHPIYLNSISPELFFDLMNSIVNVKVNVGKVEIRNKIDSQGFTSYIVQYLEYSPNTCCQDENEINIQIDIDKGYISSMKVLGYTTK